jgi:hypothetical protein
MLKNRLLSLLALGVSSTLAVACQTKGPAPGQELATEPVEVTMAEREGAPSGAQALGIPTGDHKRDYGLSLHGSPHGPDGDVGAPDSHVSGEVKLVDVGGLRFKAPEGWEYEHPASAMRRAQFGVHGDDGTAGLVVYFFGNQGAGSAQANIDRWAGQFTNADGTPVNAAKPTERQIAGLKATQIEVAGTYAGGMGAGSPQGQSQAGQRMIATIVETPDGPFYFKFLGDDKTVVENRKALEGLLASMTASQ